MDQPEDAPDLGPDRNRDRPRRAKTIFSIKRNSETGETLQQVSDRELYKRVERDMDKKPSEQDKDKP